MNSPSKQQISSISNQREKILSAINAIPLGSVASYGLVATVAGVARGHRLVARVLRENPDRNNLPWYRVIRADGYCGMTVGSSGYLQQFELLRAEGVVANRGRVDMQRYQWQPDLDILLFRPQDL